jgi:flavin reductase (DIM6/NTAB) family NADH-FMN oxidoreductase RutF
MEKKSLPNSVVGYPMPVAIVSAVVDGVVNHLAAAWITKVNSNPPLMGVALNRAHHTNRGIHQRRAFAINLPSAEQMAAVDFVGLASGAHTDKSQVFDVFFGTQPDAPLIRQCPVNLACRLIQVVDLPSHELFIAEVTATYSDEACLTSGMPDMAKLHPLLLTMPDNQYWAIGSVAGKAWSAGKSFREGLRR